MKDHELDFTGPFILTYMELELEKCPPHLQLKTLDNKAERWEHILISSKPVLLKKYLKRACHTRSGEISFSFLFSFS